MAFTMIEIALCLAIIGFALVSILLVLPTGMHTQRDTRQETIIGQDASMLLEAIRSGARGMDDLTNYVYAITNYWGRYDNQGVLVENKANGYTYKTADLASQFFPNTPYSASPISNAANIVGELSLPEFIANFYNSTSTTASYPAVADVAYANAFYNSGCYSNHIVAYVRAFSGLAAEKPPQDNPIMREETFGYRVLCVNSPIPVDGGITNLPVDQRKYVQQLSGNLRQLRLLFMWPQLPNGNVGVFRQNFRVNVAGQLVLTNIFPNVYPLYFYQPQAFGMNLQ